jgi:hypothetical protein
LNFCISKGGGVLDFNTYLLKGGIEK